MPYAPADVRQLLTHIHTLCPSVLHVRTDPCPSYEGSPEAFEATLTRRAGKALVAIPYWGTAPIPTEVSQALSQAHAIRKADSERLAELLQQLAGINPQGSWVITPAPAPEDAVTLTCQGVQGRSQQDPHLLDVLDGLCEDLPGVHEIVVDHVMEGTDNGRVRLRTFLRFVAHAGLELAAIDTAQFNQMLKTLITNTPIKHARRNRNRAYLWADQLGVKRSRISAVLDDLALLTVAVSSVRVELNAISKVRSYWERVAAAA